MNSSSHIIATLSLNRPLQGSDDHWVVVLDEEVSNLIAPGTNRSSIPLVEGGILRVGRASSNDLVIRSKLCSRYHALISTTRCGVIVCDLDSLNGSFVNGYRLEAAQDISNGDTLRVGPVELRVAMRQSRNSTEDEISRPRVLENASVVLYLADLARYKEKLSTNSPEALTACLQQWFASAREAVTANGGRIDRFLGDGILAYWLAPRGQGDAIAQSALRAAGQLQAWTQRLPKIGEQSEPWGCAVTLVSGDTLATRSSDGELDNPVLGSILNEVFAIQLRAKREQVAVTCNQGFNERVGRHVRAEQFATIQAPSLADAEVQAFTLLGLV